MLGIIYLLIFDILGAIQEVYLGNFFQTEDPVQVMVLTFGICAIFFFCLNSFNLKRLFSIFKDSPRQILLLNISTTLSWLCFFYALKLLEPAIVGMIALASGPIITIVFHKLIKGSEPTSKSDLISSLGICAGLLFLVFLTIKGDSAVGRIDSGQAYFGLLLSFVSGIGIVGNTIFSGQLYKRGSTSSELMATRFFLLLFIGVILTRDLSALVPTNLEFAGTIFVISFLTVIIPLYILHKGIELCKPIVISLLLLISPLISYFLQFFDNRLQMTVSTLLGLLVCSLFLIYGIYMRHVPKQRVTA